MQEGEEDALTALRSPPSAFSRQPEREIRNWSESSGIRGAATCLKYAFLSIIWIC